MAQSASRIRRFSLAVLLPFILLLSQQGALLHELSHWHPASSTAKTEARVEAAHVDADICRDCLGFAQIAGLAHFDLPALPGFAGLQYHFLSESSRSVAEASTPALRTRGPPLIS